MFTLMKIIILVSLLITSSAINLKYTSSFDLSVSGSTKNYQTAIAFLTSNQYVICWTVVALSGKQNIYYGVYDTSGNQIKAPIQMDDGSTGYHDHCWMAPDNSGGFVVIWMRRGVWACSNNIYVFARYFDSTFTGGPVIQVNNISTTYCVYEYYPNLIYTNTGFIGCYGSVLTKFDSSINNLGSKNVENPISKIDDAYCVLANLKNGTIAVTYVTSTSSTDSQIYYTIVQENDITKVVYPLTNISSSNVLNTYPSVALVESAPLNKFVITWLDMDTGSNSVWGQYFDLNGNPINSTFQINTSQPASIPTVFSLGVDGFIVTYGVNNVAGFQIYNINGNKDGTEQIVSGIPNLWALNTAFKQNDSLIMVSTYITSQGLLFQYTSGANSTSILCSDLTFITSVKNTKPQLAFNGGITNLYIITLTGHGTLVDSSNNPLTLNTQIPANNIYYSFTGEPQSDTFNYKINSGDTSCKVTITPCYHSCYYCSTVGNDNDNQCSACRLSDGYYPLIDKITQCYPTTNKPPGYYLNSNVWVACYSYCKDCLGYPVDSTVDMKCTLCKTGFYPKEDSLSSNCYAQPITGYYLDGNIFRKGTGCSPVCQTCNQPSTQTNPNCLTCMANYFPKEDNKTGCFTGDQSQYYFDNINKIYKKCYPKEDDPYNCYYGDQPQYYLDNGIYKRCFSACATCIIQGDDLENQCTTCLSGYYPKVNSMSNCYGGIPNYHYLDTNNIYQLCYPTCFSCSTYGTSMDHKCYSCVDGYYPKQDTLSNCFTGDQEGYCLEDMLYIKCASTTSKTTSSIYFIKLGNSCQPSPCLNNGICSIRLAKVNCECSSIFTGSLCQYDVNTVKVDDIVDQFYQTGSEQSISDLMSVLSNHFPEGSDTKIDQLFNNLGKIILI
jgi:hypothetical protein